MQTFHSSASRSALPVADSIPTGNLDTMVLPDLRFAGAVDNTSGLRMPLLPDNYGAAHVTTGAAGEESTASMPAIVAADPEKVSPSTPLSSVEGINMDSIELKFVHESHGAAATEEEHSHMLRDLWKGMVDDVLGPTKKTG